MRFIPALLVLSTYTAAAAAVDTTAVTREVGPDGRYFVITPGRCSSGPAYTSAKTGLVELIKDARGKDVKVAFEAPTVSDYDRKGVIHCAYRCTGHRTPVVVDQFIMCVSVR